MFDLVEPCARIDEEFIYEELRRTPTFFTFYILLYFSAQLSQPVILMVIVNFFFYL